MYPELAKVLEHLTSNPKVNTVRLTTNCTIIPNDDVIEQLKNNKVILQLSDYGLLEQMAKLVTILEKHNIRFRVEKYDSWEDCGCGEFNGKTVEEMKQKYKICHARGKGAGYSAIVDEGRIYVCPRSSRVDKLGIDLPLDYKTISKSETKEDIQKKIEYIYSVGYAQACNYCEQGEKTIKKVKPAIQLKTGELNSSKYTIVNREEYNELLRKAKY